MTVSPFTPVFFLGDRKTDGLDCEYMQTFSTSDTVYLQLFNNTTGIVSCRIYSLPDGSYVSSTRLNRVQVNASTYMYFAQLNFAEGSYRLEIDGIGTSEPFMVTSDPNILSKTTLIQYSMKNNRQRNDVMFFIDGMQHFFSFRVPGGFKDSGWNFSVESEQFVTQFGDIAQLYGLETTIKTFTLGGSLGVPVWFGEMLNRILVCSHVYFDGVKYSRKESSVPELNEQLEGTNSFVFTQSLQRSVNLDPTIESNNQIILRRVDNSTYRIYDTNKFRKV